MALFTDVNNKHDDFFAFAKNRPINLSSRRYHIAAEGQK